MKLVASCLLAASLALVVVACTSSTDDSGSNTAADLKKKKANTCAAAGGTCVGLSPTSCQNGYWADATKASCGSGLGVGCCLECPTLSPPAPNFCADDATPTPLKDANG